MKMNNSSALGKGVILGAALVAAFFGLESCSTPQSSPPPTPATTLDLINAIPSFDSLLPKSLQAGQATTLKSLAASRAFGDVTVLDPSKLSSVTADGYNNMKNQIKSNMVAMVLKLMKIGLRGQTVVPDKDYVMGIVTMPPDLGTAPDGSNTMDIGVLRVSKPASDETDIKWFIKVPINGTIVPYYIFVRILGTDPATMKVAVDMKATVTSGTTSFDSSQISSYDAATKQLITIAPPSTEYPNGGLGSLSTSGGITTFYNLSSNYKSVAYASDTEGGVVSSNTYNGTDNVWAEYYNDMGDLVMQQWGSSANTSNTWAAQEISSGMNVRGKSWASTKPTTIYKKTSYTSSFDSSNSVTTYNRTVSWSTDNVNWTADAALTTSWKNSDPWPMDSWSNPVWMVGLTPAAGDSIYYYQNGTWSNGTTPGTSWSWETVDTYTIGYTVPSPQTVFGKQYYMQNTFMLKYLRPSAAMANYQLKMKEGNTNYSWYNGSTWQWDTTAPTTWASIAYYNKSTWTNYDFWLENTAYSNTDPTIVNDPTSNNPDKGDIAANNLQEWNFWHWDSSSGTCQQQKALVLSTTEASPVGYDFQATSIVSDIQAQLQNVYNSTTLDPTKLQSQADAIITMPDTSSFPTY